MKRLTALLLTLLLTLTAALALGDWYTDQAEELARRVTLLPGNQTFVELYVDKQEGVEEELEMMGELTGKEPLSLTRYRYAPEKLQEYIAAYFLGERVDEDNTRLGEEILSRMNVNLPLMLNNLSGGDLWGHLSAVLSVTESYAAPEGFESCVLFADYGLDTGILITFTGNASAVTAQACFIRSEVFTTDFAADFLALLWEKE